MKFRSNALPLRPRASVSNRLAPREHLIDPPSVQVDDLEPPAFVVEVLADFGQATELGQRKTSEGVKAVRSSRPKSKSVERDLGRRHAVDQKRAILAFGDFGLVAFGVWQGTGDGFEQIGLGHDAVGAAIFVDDDRQAGRSLLELVKNTEDPCRLVDDDGLADHGHWIERLAIEDLIEQVLLEEHTKRLVDVAAADEKLLVLAFADRAEDLVVRIVRIDPVDGRT